MKAAAERRREAAQTLRDALLAVRGPDGGSDDHYREIVDRALQCIALLSGDGKILEVNAQAVRTLGASRDMLIGVALWDTPSWSTIPD